MSQFITLIEQKNTEAAAAMIADIGQAGATEALLRAEAYAELEQFIENGEINLDVDDYDKFAGSPFEALIKQLPDNDEALQCLERILENVDDVEEDLTDGTLLHLALANAADIKLIDVLISAGCELDFKDTAERSLLHHVVQTFYRQVPAGMSESELKVNYINHLISAGLDVNEKMIDGQTALHIAVGKSNNGQVIQALLDNGAEANAADNKGRSAFYNVLVEQQSLELYSIMREYATPDFEPGDENEEPLFFAFTQAVSSYSDSNLELLALLLEDGAPLDQEGLHYGESRTAFQSILECPDVKPLKIVLETIEPDVNGIDSNGNTALHIVCGVNLNFEAHRATALYKKAKLLIKAGADADLSNDAEQKPIDLASDDNLKAKTVKLLLEQQA